MVESEKVVLQQTAVLQHGGNNIAQAASGGLFAQHIDLGHKRRYQRAGPTFEGTHRIVQRAAQFFGNVL